MPKTLSMRGKIPTELSQNAEKAIEQYVTDYIAGSFIPPVPFQVGKSYLIRTITMIDVGKVKALVGNFIVLTDASWIGDTGRFYECLTKTDVFNEVEPFQHDVFINTNSIVDATPWPYTLPRTPK